MEDWIPRALQSQDEISLFLFLNVLVLLNIKRSIPLGLGDLFKRLLINYKVLVNTIFPFFHFLHIGSLIIAASGFGLWFLTFHALLYPKTPSPTSSLYSFFSILVVFIFIRALFIRFILERLGHWKEKRSFYFSNLVIYLYVGLMLLILLLLYYFSFKSLLFFGIASSLIFGFWLFLQSRFYILYLLSHLLFF